MRSQLNGHFFVNIRPNWSKIDIRRIFWCIYLFHYSFFILFLASDLDQQNLVYIWDYFPYSLPAKPYNTSFWLASFLKPKAPSIQLNVHITNTATVFQSASSFSVHLKWTFLGGPEFDPSFDLHQRSIVCSHLPKQTALSEQTNWSLIKQGWCEFTLKVAGQLTSRAGIKSRLPLGC